RRPCNVQQSKPEVLPVRLQLPELHSPRGAEEVFNEQVSAAGTEAKVDPGISPGARQQGQTKQLLVVLQLPDHNTFAGAAPGIPLEAGVEAHAVCSWRIALPLLKHPDVGQGQASNGLVTQRQDLILALAQSAGHLSGLT